MDSIFKAIGTLCVISYIISLLLNLVNMSYTHKAIRISAVLYILSSVIVPLKNIDLNIDILQIPTQEISHDAEDYIITSASYEMESRIKNILSAKNLSYTQVNVHIHEQKDGLCVENILISGTYPYEREEINQLLADYGTIIFGE